MAKLAKHMTRVVLIGKIEKYEFKTSPIEVGQGIIDTGSGKVKFTIFNNNKEEATNPHTKAADFAEQFKEGDKVHITGQDNRQYNESKDTFYEDVQVWDFRKAEEDEIDRWVYVYVGDVKELNDEGLTLSFIDYKNNEKLFQIKFNQKTKIPHGLEVGDRIKVKGTVKNGLITDFFGDGEFSTIRTAAEIKIENSKNEIEESNSESNSSNDESGLWS